MTEDTHHFKMNTFIAHENPFLRFTSRSLHLLRDLVTSTVAERQRHKGRFVITVDSHYRRQAAEFFIFAWASTVMNIRRL